MKPKIVSRPRAAVRRIRARKPRSITVALLKRICEEAERAYHFADGHRVQRPYASWLNPQLRKVLMLLEDIQTGEQRTQDA